MNAHAVNKMTFDIACPDEVIARRLQYDLTHYIVPQLGKTMDKLFNAAAGSGETLAIDRIEIDLGMVTPGMFSGSELLARLSAGLREALQHEKTGRLDNGSLLSLQNEAPVIIPDKERLYQLIDYFLQQGDLPWWADKTGNINLEEIINRIISDDPGAWQRLLHRHAHHPTGQQRIIWQLKKIIDKINAQWEISPYEKFLQLISVPEKSVAKRRRTLMIKELMQRFGEPAQPKNFITLLEEINITKFKRMREQASENSLRRLLGKLSIYELIFLHRSKFPLKENIEAIEREEIISSVMVQLKGITENGIDVLSNMSDSDLASLEKIFTQIKNEEQQRAAYEKSILANEIFLRADLLQSPVTQPLFKQLPRKLVAQYKNIVENKISPTQLQKEEALELIVKKLNDKHIAALHALSSMPAEQLHALLQSPPINEVIVDDEEEERRIIVENAGLCLVAAYLPALFRVTRLTKNETFVNRRDMEKAIQLLQYIAGGSKSDPEYLLQLNKILCGIMPEEPVRRLKTLSKKYTEEADDLLRSLIANWKALRNTTIDGFRQSFLLRKGILKAGMNGYVLQVESQGHDVLLNSIPWSYSLIKLPWMKKPIHVEWVAG